MTQQTQGGYAGRARSIVATPVFVRLMPIMTVLVLIGCHDLTTVSEPDTILPSAMQTPAGALELRVGAIGAFATNFSYAVIGTGLISDELTIQSDFEGTQGQQADQRVETDGLPGLTAPPGPFPYEGVSGARVDALIALQALERYDPNDRPYIAELFALVGYTELLFSEAMCDGVPLSSVQNGSPVAGSPTTRTGLLNQAMAHFDSALTYATSSDSIGNLATVGLARALLDMGSTTKAATLVHSVPTGYRYVVQFNVNTNNANYFSLYLVGYPIYQISDHEGVNGLNFVSAQDPRITVDSTGSGPISLASGVEARLIEAEAALASGNTSQWISDLNLLRADSADTHVAGLAPIVDPGTPSSQVDSLFTERAFWLFTTAHRQGDLRRLVRQYGRAINSVFPTGPYAFGGTYGNDTNFPVVGEKQSGPECSNRNP